ncbi:MAG: flagellar biosynthesis anti-sigma factor FlgM [Planctomycetota bacterium]|nr:MAG: flagellar biosynthesis anti-sigma factor FlgM [Planctomycetota bacterium]REJ93166.1 MAG: flagellar biosynthesis anti-sigma factor FlgM [Planctomycetota bacterium]REK23351.1 MAG: flagellar biosynthesis anti-sigma factor FlgM [Planctomycetota bacterium]REK47154.1 MAG: flagellar biosynthesis anti-sigma factor FlgM [Planctomycetota bacterium]
MQINGPAHVHGAQPIRAPHNAVTNPTPTPTRATRGADEVTISPEADFLSRISELPEIRQDRVNELRAKIAEGSYDVDGNLEKALERLLDEIG